MERPLPLTAGASGDFSAGNSDVVDLTLDEGVLGRRASGDSRCQQLKKLAEDARTFNPMPLAVVSSVRALPFSLFVCPIV